MKTYPLVKEVDKMEKKKSPKTKTMVNHQKKMVRENLLNLMTQAQLRVHSLLEIYHIVFGKMISVISSQKLEKLLM